MRPEKAAPQNDLSQTLGLVAKGDKAALRSIYVRQSARMFGLALAILRDRVAAADALQEGFVRIWQHARDFDPRRAAAEAWIASMVRHTALDLARQRGREIPSDDPSIDDGIIDPEAIDGLLATEAGKRTHAALLRIDANSRHGLILAYANGLSYGELAAEVDLPVAKIRSWIHRAMLALRANVT